MSHRNNPIGRGPSPLYLALIVVAGCGAGNGTDSSERAPVLTAATLGEQTVLTAGEYAAQPRYAEANLQNGATQSQICRACHGFEPGGPALLGPNLHGMFGKPAGRRDDYEYSPALAEADFVWTPRALEAWLAQPSTFLPGNRMTFPGVLDPRNRTDLVAYLLEVTDDTEKEDHE